MSRPGTPLSIGSIIHCTRFSRSLWARLLPAGTNKCRASLPPLGYGALARHTGSGWLRPIGGLPLREQRKTRYQASWPGQASRGIGGLPQGSLGRPLRARAAVPPPLEPGTGLRGTGLFPNADIRKSTERSPESSRYPIWQHTRPAGQGALAANLSSVEGVAVFRKLAHSPW